MKIRVLSDLHLEFQDWNPPDVKADIVVLAGDIHSGIRGIEWARRHSAGMDSRKIAGRLRRPNHPGLSSPAASPEHPSKVPGLASQPELCQRSIPADGAPIAIWIHGHTHESCDYFERGTRVVCNPRGYGPFELNAAFDPILTIEVDTSPIIPLRRHPERIEPPAASHDHNRIGCAEAA